MQLEPGARVELEIERLAAGGDGVGHVGGCVVFVPLAAPGDRARVEVRELKRRYARAELVEVLHPGPSRRDARCPYYGRCGGCSWMHLTEEEQGRARRAILRDALERIAHRTPPEIEWIASPAAFGYRALARAAYSDGRIGFRARRSHRVIDVERCAVLDPPTQRALERAREKPPRGRGELELRGFDRALGLRVGAGSFFQANRALWETWQRAVVEACGTGERAVELYAGVGFYTVGLERGFESVVAVERGRAARDLARNVTGPNTRVVRAACEDFASRELPDLRPDVVLLNPPRAGCRPPVVDGLRRVAAPRVVYVSCDPATLARDLASLGVEYALERVVAIDALPQTHHVEAFAVLSRVRSLTAQPSAS